MALTKISQLLFTLNLFDGNSWNNFFSGLGAFFGRIFYAVIICGLGRIADICQLIFKKLAGISPNGVQFVGENGTEVYNGDIVMYIIQSSAVRNVLIALLVLAVVILLIATFTAVIKTEFAKDGNNNKRKVIKYAFRGLANFVLVPVICLFGLFIGNALLRAIDGATNPTGDNTKLSAQIFLAGGYNANRARQSELKDESSGTLGYIADSFGARLVGQGDFEGTANFGVFLDDDPGMFGARRAADKIDAFFANGYLIKVSDGGVLTISLTVPKAFIGNTGTTTQSASSNIDLEELGLWYDGAFGSDIKVNMITEISITQSIVDDRGVIELRDLGSYISFDIYNIGLVYTYYNLNLGSFDYLISAVSLIFCAYTLLITVLGLIKRLFYLSTLFFISAPVCAIYPLDEGKALERWRADFIKNVLSAYSVVIVMNLFLALLPTLLNMELFIDWSVDLFPLPIPLSFANYLARLLIVIGALTFFKDATKQLAAIIGGAEANSDGSDAAGKFSKNVGRVAGGVAIAGGVAKVAGKAVGAGISWYDKKAHKAMNNYDFYDPEKEKSKNDQDAQAQKDVQAQLAGTTGDSGSANSLNSVTTGSGSPNGMVSGTTASEKAAKEAEAKAAHDAKVQKSLFNSTENEKAKKAMQEHTGLYKVLSGYHIKAIHNANITRKIRGAFGGLTSAMGGIVTGKGKVKDAFNWSKGNKNFRDAEDKRKTKVDEAQGKAAETRQHADEVADDRALHSSLHQGDREHLDGVMQRTQASGGLNSENASFNPNSEASSNESLEKDMKHTEAKIQETSEKVEKLKKENEQLKLKQEEMDKKISNSNTSGKKGK